MTRVFGPTGTEYLFVMVSGQLLCYSVTSGQLVVKTGELGFEFESANYGDVYLDDEDQEEDEEDEGTRKTQGLYLFQTTNFRLIQIQSVSRRQF